MLTQANALKIPLADESVHCCISSPPYWGLRDYGLATWEGGDAGCDHRHKAARNDGGRVNVDGFHGSAKPDSDKGPMYDNACPKCGAIRYDAGIGLEPTPDEYIANMVQVGREIWRVLRDDGSFWLNLDDSYSSQGGSNANKNRQINTGQRKVVDSGAVPDKVRKGVPGLKPKDLCGIPWSYVT